MFAKSSVRTKMVDKLIDKLMAKIIVTVGLLVLSMACVSAASTSTSQDLGTYQLGAGITGRQMDIEFSKHYPAFTYMLRQEDGGMDSRDSNGNAIPGLFNPGKYGSVGSFYPQQSAASMAFPTDSKLMQGMYEMGVPGVGSFSGLWNSDLKETMQKLQAGTVTARTMQFPSNAGKAAQAQQLSQGIGAGNAMGEAAKGQASAAINYCAAYLQNFTVEDGNIWNTIRANIFVPLGILLLIPGAILTQVKVIVAAGNPMAQDTEAGSPTLEEVQPFEGIFRSIIAIFLVLSSNLIVNYGIDFSNSVILSISSEYQILFGSNLYADALGAEVRAFPVRSLKQEQNTGTPPVWTPTSVTDQATFEQNYYDNTDPSKVDESMPSGAMASRLVANTGNAGMTAAWNILCAFQMVYLHYLHLVGPVVAGLWVWPIRALRGAFSSWVEGVITICCWSLFWNTVVLLMACFKGVDDTGTVIMSALNFLSTACVKFAFDFAGLVSAAGEQAAQQAMKSGGSGGGKGKGGGGKAGAAKGGRKGGHNPHNPLAPHPGLTPHPGPTHPSKAPSLTNVQAKRMDGLNKKPAQTPKTAAQKSPIKPRLNNGNSDFKPASYNPLHQASATFEQHGKRMGTSEPPLFARSTSAASSDKSHTSAFQSGSGKENFSLSFGKDGKISGISLSAGHSGPQASFNHADLSHGGMQTKEFAGGKLSVDTKNGTTSATAQFADGHKESLSIDKNGNVSMSSNGGPEVPHGNAMNGPGKDAMALPDGNKGAAFLSKDGSQLFVPNKEGNYDSLSLSGKNSSGQFELGNQSINFSRSEAGNGFNANMSINDTASGMHHSAAIASEGNGNASIRSTDEAGNLSRMAYENDGNTAKYSTFDANNHLTQQDLVNGANGSTKYFDADSKLLGSTTWNAAADGSGYQKTLFNGENTQLATMNHQNLGDGMYRDTVSDASGHMRSMQEGKVNADGSEQKESFKYGADGQMTYSQSANYDTHGQFVNGTTSTFENGNRVSESAISPMADGNGYLARDTHFDGQGNAVGTTTSHLDANGSVVGGHYNGLLQQASYSPTESFGAAQASNGFQRQSEAPMHNGFQGQNEAPLHNGFQAQSEAPMHNGFQRQAEALARAAASDPATNMSALEHFTGLNESQAQQFAGAASAGNYRSEAQVLAQGAQSSNDYSHLQQFTGLNEQQAHTFAQDVAHNDYRGEAQLMAQAAHASNDNSNLQQFTGMNEHQAQNFSQDVAHNNFQGEMQVMAQAAHTSNDYTNLQQFGGLNEQQAQNFSQDVAHNNYQGEMQVMAQAAQGSNDYSNLQQFGGLNEQQAQNFSQDVANNNYQGEMQVMAQAAQGSNDYTNLQQFGGLNEQQAQNFAQDVANNNYQGEMQVLSQAACETNNYSALSQYTGIENSSQLQHMVHQASDGDLTAQTYLMASGAVNQMQSEPDQSQSILSNFTHATNMSSESASSLFERTAAGDPYALTQMVAAQVQAAPEANQAYISELSQSTGLSTNAISTSISHAAAGDMFATTHLLAAETVNAAAQGNTQFVNHVANQAGLSDQQVLQLAHSVVQDNGLSPIHLASAIAVHSYDQGDTRIMQHLQDSTGADVETIRQASHYSPVQQMEAVTQQTALQTAMHVNHTSTPPTEVSTPPQPFVPDPVAVTHTTSIAPTVTPVSGVRSTSPAATTKEPPIGANRSSGLLEAGLAKIQASRANQGYHLRKIDSPNAGANTNGAPPSAHGFFAKEGAGDQSNQPAIGEYSSLESQMKDAASHNDKPTRSLNDILAGAGTGNSSNSQEALVNAHINYGAVSQLLQEGKVHQVREAFAQIAQQLKQLDPQPESIEVLRNFEKVLDQYHLPEQAKQVKDLRGSGRHDKLGQSN